MKNLLMAALAIFCSTQAFAYKVKIKNDTDDSRIKVSFGRADVQSFELDVDQERTVEISDSSPVKRVKIKGLSGRAKGKKAEFKVLDKKLGKKFELEIETDNAGNIQFDEERAWLL